MVKTIYPQGHENTPIHSKHYLSYPIADGNSNMSSVKTYQNIDKEDEKSNFAISRMEDIYAKRNGKVDEPHRHDFYTVLLVKEAKGIHKVDFNCYELGMNQVYFVAPGQVHQVMEEDRSLGYAMTFSTDFLIQNSIPISFISDLNLFQNYGETPPLTISTEEFELVFSFSNEMYTLFQGEQNKKFLSIGSYLKLLLIQCSNHCGLEGH